MFIDIALYTKLHFTISNWYGSLRCHLVSTRIGVHRFLELASHQCTSALVSNSSTLMDIVKHQARKTHPLIRQAAQYVQAACERYNNYNSSVIVAKSLLVVTPLVTRSCTPQEYTLGNHRLGRDNGSVLSVAQLCIQQCSLFEHAYSCTFSSMRCLG